ncbi:MAG: hypothetical protein WBN68_19195 [Sedimenticolaceae bacterium]
MPTTSHLTTSAAIVTILLVGLPCRAVAAPPISCHIHPPGSTPERPVGIIGPFDSIKACETERHTRFGTAGRCHCAADFSPRWLDPPAPELPGQSPLG